ncbi:MAG: hypothetical protein M3Z66_12870 [Chloroflexota bacterium]|nr:hypothetical protein [Chloroflexota bacterium]
MLIGTIVKSNSHISYMCRVYGKLETERVPDPRQYAFGTFVTLAPIDGSDVRLVGVVRDTLLLNPEYGNLGPRLSSDRELAVFSPDYLNERGVLVDVLVLGWREGEWARHAVPPLSAQVGTLVETMPAVEIGDFHRDRQGRFLIGYLPQLMTGSDPMIASLLLAVLDRLEPSFPEQAKVIGVLKNNLAWKARVVPAG